MIIREEIDVTRELSEEERAMLRRAMEMPITYDDSPELTEEQLAKFKRASEIRREERVKQTVTLRLSPKALPKQDHLAKDTHPFSAECLKKR